MRRTIPLLATMALTLLVASGVTLAMGVGSAAAQSSVVGPGESIQKAVNAADPGDTIVVRGVHREDVLIRKNGIKLRGIENAVIEAPSRAKADSPCSKITGPEGICVLGDANIETGELTGPRVRDVSVSGFTFRGFDVPGKGGSTAYVIDFFGTRNTTITQNRVMGNVAGGIIVTKSINTTIANNDVTGDPVSEAEGIAVGAVRDARIVNNDVGDYRIGIEADQNSVGTTIAGNESTGNSLTGISSFEASGTKILSNTTRRNEVVGIFVGYKQRANAKVLGNDVSGSEFGMFVAAAQRGSFAANEAHGNCAGMVFQGDFGGPVGFFEVKGNTVEDNTRACPAEQGRATFSGIGIGLFGTRDMEVRANNVSGNVPTGPTAVSGGVVVATDPLFGGDTKPTDNTVVANNFGRNRPDIFYDKSGSGNAFGPNNCNSSVPTRLCN
jgi:parallel beta-helix repeat protein